MGNQVASANGVSTEQRMAEVIAYRNLAAKLKETYREARLGENGNQLMSLPIWFQEFYETEPWEFWSKCYKHLDAVVQAETLRVWMDYPEHWEIPAQLRRAGIDPGKVVFCNGWGMYPIAKPRGLPQADVVLPGDIPVAEACTSQYGTYVRGAIGNPPVATLATWHRVYKRPTASKTAIERCIRMCVLSRLVGRRLTTSKELLVAEAKAFFGWALYKVGGDYPAGPGELQPVVVLSDTAKEVMRALLLDDEFVILVHQLPKRMGA